MKAAFSTSLLHISARGWSTYIE